MKAVCTEVSVLCKSAHHCKAVPAAVLRWTSAQTRWVTRARRCVMLGQTRPLFVHTCPLCSPTFGSCRMDCKSSMTTWDRSDTTGMHARHHSMLGQTRPLFALMCQCCSLSCVVLETGCEGRTTHMHVLRHGAHACRWFGRLRSNMTAVCADVSALSSDLPVMAHGLQPHYN